MEDFGNYSFNYESTLTKEPSTLNLKTVKREMPHTIAKAANKSGAYYSNSMLERILRSQVEKDWMNAYKRKLLGIRYQQVLDAHKLRQMELESGMNQGAFGTIGTIGSAALAGFGNKQLPPVQGAQRY